MRRKWRIWNRILRFKCVYLSFHMGSNGLLLLQLRRNRFGYRKITVVTGASSSRVDFCLPVRCWASVDGLLSVYLLGTFISCAFGVIWNSKIVRCCGSLVRWVGVTYSVCLSVCLSTLLFPLCIDLLRFVISCYSFISMSTLKSRS